MFICRNHQANLSGMILESLVKEPELKEEEK